MSTNPFLEKHLEFLIESVDELAQEHVRLQPPAIIHTMGFSERT